MYEAERNLAHLLHCFYYSDRASQTEVSKVSFYRDREGNLQKENINEFISAAMERKISSRTALLLYINTVTQSVHR